MKCAGCGEENTNDAALCVKCGASLRAGEPTSRQGQSSGESDPVEILIPYRNPTALSAYYLGVFSLIPCVGVPLALAAIPLGIHGLRFLKKNPKARGVVHAWVGIVLGSLVLAAHTVVLVLLLLSSHGD